EYLTVSNHGYLGYLVLINADFWYELSDEIQVIILDVIEEVNEWEMKMAKEVNEENYHILKNCNCIEMYELSKKEQQSWEEALHHVYNTIVEKYRVTQILYT